MEGIFSYLLWKEIQTNQSQAPRSAAEMEMRLEVELFVVPISRSCLNVTNCSQHLKWKTKLRLKTRTNCRRVKCKNSFLTLSFKVSGVEKLLNENCRRVFFWLDNYSEKRHIFFLKYWHQHVEKVLKNFQKDLPSTFLKNFGIWKNMAFGFLCHCALWLDKWRKREELSKDQIKEWL